MWAFIVKCVNVLCDSASMHKNVIDHVPTFWVARACLTYLYPWQKRYEPTYLHNLQSVNLTVSVFQVQHSECKNDFFFFAIYRKERKRRSKRLSHNRSQFANWRIKKPNDITTLFIHMVDLCGIHDRCQRRFVALLLGFLFFAKTKQISSSTSRFERKKESTQIIVLVTEMR